jgi:hypothetical protein
MIRVDYYESQNREEACAHVCGMEVGEFPISANG